jgi:hypothetical protein
MMQSSSKKLSIKEQKNKRISMMDTQTGKLEFGSGGSNVGAVGGNAMDKLK